MPRYIDADDLENITVATDSNGYLKRIDAPTADVQEVKHGHIIHRNVRFMPYAVAEECSVCHNWGLILTFKANYCPACGAKWTEKEK